MRSLAPIALVVVALLSSGCGSSSSANAASYTVTPKSGGLASEIYVTFTGAPATSRRLMHAFDATHQGYMAASTPIDQTQCDISAGGGKVDISVVAAVGLDTSVWKNLCTALSQRF